MPRDLDEINRLDFQHYLLRSTLRGNFAAPITNPRDILDVGTGTGRWAIEMAQLFPDANVIGLDVNLPVVDEQAATGVEARPDNYAFVPGNILEGLPFPDESFDFVHMRLLVSAMPHDQWPRVVSELARVTRPGGWVESVETTLMEGGGPALAQIIKWGEPVMARRNIQMQDGARVGEYMNAAGLVNVYARRLELPCGRAGGRGGRVGAMVATDYMTGAKAFAGLIVAQGLASQAAVDAVLKGAETELDSRQVTVTAPIYLAYGQRAYAKPDT
jgi:ubiquinone/menaquinone biosynthesis C-methylase UbiE